ncbi:hypothetical protein MASR2M70_13610 [Bacillota bacterium]
MKFRETEPAAANVPEAAAAAENSFNARQAAGLNYDIVAGLLGCVIGKKTVVVLQMIDSHTRSADTGSACRLLLPA